MAKVTKAPAEVIYPLPMVLVSCGIGRRANIIALARASALCREPPLMGICVHRSRHSYGLIEEAGAFVINLPRVDQVRWVDHCGSVSGRDEDKWAACGFTPVPAAEVEVPLIAECPVNVECRVRETLPLGSHDLFVGEVLSVQVDEGLLDERGYLDYGRTQPLALIGMDYWRFGERMETCHYTKRG